MRKYSKETTVGIFVVIGLMAIGYLTINLGDVSFLGDNSCPLYARFSSVTGLRTGSAVNMLGLEIGKVGSLTIDALNRGDLPILKAVTVLSAIALVVFNLLSDLLYAWADPRVRLS